MYLKLVAYALIPIILFFLPSDYFDNGRATCLSVLLLDTPCWACGMTRACMRMIHFEVNDATDFNVLVLIVFPILVGIWILWFRNDLKKLKSMKAEA